MTENKAEPYPKLFFKFSRSNFKKKSLAKPEYTDMNFKVS